MEFAPYVPDVREKMAVGGEPRMFSPMSMRLDSRRTESEISFVADIDGFVCVMQEVDTAQDPKAKVTLRRKICPDLPLLSRITRALSGIAAWKN